jgi:2-haloacid dehalogenase
LLDLDGTLYDYDKAHAPALAAALDHISVRCARSVEVCRTAVERSRQEVHQRLRGTAACHNRLLYFQGACERLDVGAFPLALEAYHVYWDAFLKNAVLFDGVQSFLKTFSRTPIVLVTDLTADIQHRKVTAFGLSSAVKFLVTSEEAGGEKPGALPFRLALEKLGLATQDVCMIGDDFDKDIAGAAALGIFPIWFNPSGKLPPAGQRPVHHQAVSFDRIQEFLQHE